MLSKSYQKKIQKAVDNASEEMWSLTKKENEFLFGSIREIFYDLFEEIFRIVLPGLRDAGFRVSSTLVDFEKLVWDEDPDKLDDRIKKYVDEVEDFDEKTNPYYYIPKEKFDTNFRLLDRLLSNEAWHMKEAIIYEKLKKDYPYCEINSGNCGCCTGTSGIIETASLDKLPPFHPDCECSVEYYTEEEYEEMKKS